MDENFVNTFQQGSHPVLVDSNVDDRARQEFVKSLKTKIQQGLLPAVSGAYFQRAMPAFQKATGNPPQDYRDARKAFRDDPLFKAYLSINRISQELKRFSVIDALAEQEEALERRASEIPHAGGSLELDPDLEIPKYVSSIDIHCKPGGYCGPENAGKLHAGALYDRGVYLYAMGYMGPNNDDMGRSVCNNIKRKHPQFRPERILDMGCTVGHSTLPYAELFPQASVHAIDVAGACVTYAHHRAEGLGLPVHFKQMNAESTRYEDESFDLVVSHILLHETSNKAMPKIFHEAYRLLKPGGQKIQAELPPIEAKEP